jgi:hypothetical protein
MRDRERRSRGIFLLSLTFARAPSAQVGASRTGERSRERRKRKKKEKELAGEVVEGGGEPKGFSGA